MDKCFYCCYGFSLRVSLPAEHVRKLEVCEKMYNYVMNIALILLSFKFNIFTAKNESFQVC